MRFHAIDSGDGDGGWLRLVGQLWPAYRAWYLGAGGARASLSQCQEAVALYMPHYLPEWQRLCAITGADEVLAAFLSLYNPPPYLSACSQAVWPGADPLLVRNYDYAAKAFDGVCLRTEWSGHAVMGTSDCLVGLVDGINDAGLALSLTFGGSNECGNGFGVPLIMRYVLQTCETADQAGTTLAGLPTHMAYNVTALDAQRHIVTAQLAPGRAAVLTRSPVATNHQSKIRSVAHARMTATVERERFLLRRMMLREESAEDFIGSFMKPPLYSLAFARGFGTLFTAAYRPQERRLDYHWPGHSWVQHLQSFEPGARDVNFPVITPGLSLSR